MVARRHKQENVESRCDRCHCREKLSECEFTFRYPLRYWKSLFQQEEEKRLTNRRKAKMGERWGFDWKKPPTFWMFLCPACWEACSRPWDGWPMHFRERVLTLPVERPSAKSSCL
jgi:hypothetical protein